MADNEPFKQSVEARAKKLSHLGTLECQTVEK